MKEPLNKHQQRTEATRRKLLDAALRVFTRDGFESARLEDIAAEAGHTRGAFYAHFTTKEDLFIALLEHYAAKRVADLVRAMNGNKADPEACRKAMREYYVGKAKDRKWSILNLEFKLYIIRRPKHSAQFAEAHERIRAAFHLELKNFMPAIVANGPAAERLAKILLEVIIHGLMLENAYDPRRISGSEMEHVLGRMFDLLTSTALQPKRRRLTVAG